MGHTTQHHCRHFSKREMSFTVCKTSFFFDFQSKEDVKGKEKSDTVSKYVSLDIGINTCTHILILLRVMCFNIKRSFKTSEAFLEVSFQLLTSK